MTAFKSVGLFFLFVLVSLTSSAGIVPYTRGLLKTPEDLSTRPYVNTSSGEFTTEITPIWSGLSSFDRSKKGVITFGINHHFPTTSPNFRAEVKVVLTKYATLSSSGVVDTITLQISNYPEDSLSFLDKQSYVFDNVEKFDVKLILAKLEGYDQTYLRENLYIQGDVYVDRVYDFTGQLTTPLTINSLYTDEPLDLNCDDQADEYVISWDPVEGAEEYQLEWLYINDYDKVIGDLSVDFRLNSTRITTSQANYHLSLVFDKGYICYRVRAVGRSMTDVSRFIFTPWSTADGPVPVSSCNYYQQTTPYDVLKNWQYSSTYAEEGKKKEVISFFDGSLRNRQMVTKINSDNTTIVGETIYDYQGRPAIQVLPVPVAPTDCETPDAENSLKYYSKFNRKNETDAYTKLDFDTSSMTDSCSTILGPMHPSSGASNYYSNSNPAAVGIHGYLPDAHNFPFSQVEYTPDNTGRISRQGGVGAEFQLGSGHETKYFYGHPLQEQLDRLFGSEVGDYAHYQKNMVVDPNGQVSVSYLDQEGRVIATSLAGEAPDNLISLESAAEASPLTADLFAPDAQGNTNSNVLGINGRSKVFNQTILLSSKTTLQIDYDLNVTPFIDTCLSLDSSVCFNCIYDLKIEVRDMCGILVSPQTVSNKLSGRFELDTTNQVIFKTDCANFGFDTTFIIDSLPVGSYQISKTLTINEAAIEAYVAMYVNDSINRCKPGYDEILEEVQATTDNDCSDDFSCAECIENLGPLLDYIANGGTEDGYNLEVVACNAPCTPISYYETMRMLLKGDVMPSGQYGQYSDASGIQVGMYPLSVLNVSNILPKSPNSDWKHPKYDIESTVLDHYYDEDGITISRIYLQNVVIASNVVTSSLPIIDAGATIGTHVFLDATTNSYYTYAEYLTNVADFIGYYGSNLQWANSLVYYHPEYPILKYYRTLTQEIVPGDRFTSEGFDAAMMSVNTWDDAITAGFIKSTYSTESVNNRIADFMTDTTHSVWDPVAYYDAPLYRLQNKVANFITINGVNYSMMQFAGITTRCTNLQLGAYPSSACTLWGDDFGLDSTENEAKRDEAWMAFRSLYFSAKQKILQDLVTYATINDSEYYGYNACIGNDAFNPFENGFFEPLFSLGFFYTSSGQFTNVNQPCSFYRMAFYQNKEIRFGTPSRVSDKSANEIAYQQYLVTGQCPNAASLQSVLNEVAYTNQLDDVSFSLNSLNSFSGFLLSLNNFDAQTPNQNLNWVQTTINSSILEVLWNEVGGSAFATLELMKDPLDTLGYSWSQVIGFSNLYFTELSAGIYEFTVLAKVQMSGQIYFVPITGTTTLPIGNCQFEDVCEKNDLGNEMQHLLQAITAFDLLGSTTAFNLSTEDAFDPFVTTNIEHAVSLSSPGNLSWIFDPAIPGFKITNAANSDYLRLGINSFSPSTFTISNMNLIDAIDELVVGPNNTFELVCNDAYGNYLVTISLDAVRVTSGGLQSIELGDCGLPTPLLCEGEPYRNLEDLKAVFQDVLVNQNAPFDLYNSLELTSSLETQLNAPGGVLTGTVSSLFAGAKRLRFNLPTDYCDLTLNYDSIPGVNFSFDSIVSVEELQVSGETNSFGAHNSFDLTVNFSSGGIIHSTILKGISCLNLKECISCTGDITVSYTASQLDSIDSVYISTYILVESNTMNDYQYYCNLVDTFNVHHGLSPLDSNFVQKLNYFEFFTQIASNNLGAYYGYMNSFVDSLDSYYFLQNPAVFNSIHNGFNSVQLQYTRYLNAVDLYNSQRDGVILDHITPVTLLEFITSIYSEDCNNYISYLLGHLSDPGATQTVLEYPYDWLALYYPTDCLVRYLDYAEAYLDHLASNPFCAPQSLGSGQLINFSQFQSIGLCNTSCGLDTLAYFINQLETTSSCNFILPIIPNSCPSYEADTTLCHTAINSYYSWIDEFNSCNWAIMNNVTLDYEYNTWEELYTNGFCKCVKLYTGYLNNYIIPFDSLAILTPPVTLSEFCINQIPEIEVKCSEASYQQYLGCVALYNSKAMANESEDLITYVISEQVFYQEGLCNCVDDYCAELNLVSDGLKEFDLMPNILTFCSGDLVIPCPNDSINIAAEPFIIEFNDPCEEFYQANTENTAYIAFEEQTQAMQTDISSRYIQHCLGALENLSMTYNEIEHHFTLYYYDQAGNLIKTVPPEGVEFVDVDNSTIKAAILSDRANNTHQIVTSHRMQTTYLYNSLNQLVAQNMPDQDEMQVLESTLPNGLPVQLSTTAIQMVNSNQGYLTGFMTTSNAPMGSRGYLFSTTNGGQNWVRVTNTIASDLKRVRMINSNSGLAVGTSGVLLLTQDGGATWDLVDTYSSNIQEDFVSLEVSTTDGYALTRSGKIIKCTTAGLVSSHAVAPTNTSYTATEFTDFSLQNNYSTTTGILYIASLNDGSTDFDAILLNNGSSVFTLEKVLAADLNALSFFTASEGTVAGLDGNLSILSGTSSSDFVQTMKVSGTVSAIDQIQMLNAQIGIARLEENSQKVIRTTTNGGKTWLPLSNEYVDANVTFIKRSGSTTLEVLIQGYLNGSAYSKTVLLASNGIISELNQTPTAVQNINLKVVYAYQDGLKTTVFGIDATDKLYRSNTYIASGTTLQFTEITDAGAIADAKQLIVLKDGTDIFVHVLLTTGGMKQTTASSIMGTYATFATVSGATSLVWMDKITVSSTDYVVGYNSSDTKIYGKTASGSLSGFTTTISLGTSVITKLAVHGTQLTLVGTNGGIFTSGSISTLPSTIAFYARQDHRLPALNALKKGVSTVLITGENGLFISRAISTSTAIASVKPLHTLSDLYAANEFVSSSITYYLVGGSQGYFSQFKASNLDETSLYTTAGLTVTDHSNAVSFYDIAVSSKTVYVVGGNGSVYYTPDITTDLLIPTVPVTTQSLRSVCFNGSLKAVVAGSAATLIRYHSQSGSVNNRIFSSKYRDVHFANGQFGTLIGDHFLVRSTTDGGLTWKMNLPAAALALSSSNIDNLRKVWTVKESNTSHFALIGGYDNYVTVVNNGVFASTSITGQISDIQFSKNSPLIGYLSINSTANGIRKITLTPSTLLGYTFSLSADLATSTDLIHAIHVFENQSVAFVGGSGKINFYNSGGLGSSYTLATISGATFRDVYFHDDVTGYAVGDAGKWYHLSSNSNDATTHAILSGGLITSQQTITDPEIGTATDYNIMAMAFNSRTTGVYGGYYTNGTYVSTKKAMVRALRHEGGMFTARFYYDRLGRIVTSQNSRQLQESKFSYTLYDELGRVYEAGEKTENGSGDPKFGSIFGADVGGITVPSVVDDVKLETWLSNDATSTRKEVTRSYYDATNTHIEPSLPILLTEATQRKRIVHVTYEAIYDGLDEVYDHATHYDYDVHGNVKTLLQENQLIGAISGINQHRFKRMDYVYDLISGNVHRVDYETGNADQWHHAYNYDSDNRITDVYTTKETPLLDINSSIASMQNEPEINPMWDQEASYEYYQHGPLARTTLGDQEVQGIDYVYTLQGWIKGVNSNSLDANRDPKKDGDVASDNKLIARDVFGYSLHYFTGDYTPILSPDDFLANQASSDLTANSSDLYNGNIGRMITTITDPNSRHILPLGNAYQYDQLNRLKQAKSFNNLDLGSNEWGSGGTTMYYNAFTYDANGNIETQVRQNQGGATIDDLTYNYHDVLGKRIRNRLYGVNDTESSSSFSDDIDDMGTFDTTDLGINVSNNYVYDAEGRLIKDVQEEIDSIAWRVDGKVKFILRPTSSAKKTVSFDYDAMGHRIAKHSYTSNNSYLLEKSTYYILDAQGNTMSVYERVVDTEAESIAFAQAEKHIYGSSRLGMHNEWVPMLGSQNETYSMEYVDHRIGERSYELSNHLGNVLSVITDKVIPHDESSDGDIDWYLADIRQSTDYSPFGVILENRNLKKSVVVSQNCYDVTEYDTTFVLNFQTEEGPTGWATYNGGQITPPKTPNLTVTDSLNLISILSDSIYIFPGPGGVPPGHYVTPPSLIHYSVLLSLTDGETYHTEFDFDGGDCLSTPFSVSVVNFGETIPLTSSGHYNFSKFYSTSLGSTPGNRRLTFDIYGDNDSICHALITNLKVYSLDSIGTTEHCDTT
jgi:photosystem II stability/assembly factor-like uncharacterized protein